MSIRAAFYLLLAASLIVVSSWSQARAEGVAEAPAVELSELSLSDSDDAAETDDSLELAEDVEPADNAEETEEASLDGPVDLFDAIDAGDVNVKFIAKSDRRGRILIENTSDQPIEVLLPEAFVGRPVLAQNFGGGGGGGRGGGGGGGGGGNQSVGGGGGGGGQGGGGGGGLFSIPPAEIAKVDVALLCLDHGKKNPSSSKPYELIRPEEHLSDSPAVVELIAAFGRGELQRGAAQAAVWNLNSEVSWQQLAAKLDGTARSFVRSPYFSHAEIEQGVAYAAEAVRRASLIEPSQQDSDESMGEPSRYAEARAN